VIEFLELAASAISAPTATPMPKPIPIEVQGLLWWTVWSA
jgi:hypothetical protein